MQNILKADERYEKLARETDLSHNFVFDNVADEEICEVCGDDWGGEDICPKKFAQALERAVLEAKIEAMQWAKDRWTAEPIYPPSDAIEEEYERLRTRLAELKEGK